MTSFSSVFNVSIIVWSRSNAAVKYARTISVLDLLNVLPKSLKLNTLFYRRYWCRKVNKWCVTTCYFVNIIKKSEQTGANLYDTLLGIPDKGYTIKGLFFCNSWDVSYSGPAKGSGPPYFQPLIEPWIVIQDAYYGDALLITLW